MARWCRPRSRKVPDLNEPAGIHLAGVMVQACSLFARRGYNVEGIFCIPIGDGAESRIWLLVNEDQRLEQLTKQLLKLEDVRGVRRHSASHDVFVRQEEFFH